MDALQKVMLSSGASLADTLIANGQIVSLDHFTVENLRPYIARDGKVKVWNSAQKKGIVTNTPAALRYDEWKDIDRKVLKISTQRLKAVGDLIGRGLTHNLGGLGATVAMWQRSSDFSGADVSMDGMKDGEEDKINYDYKSVPVPIVHKDFRINLRHLEASRRMGEGVDTAMAELAARVVAEKTEDMLLSGTPVQVDGGIVYGYTNHPDIGLATLTKQWTDGTKTGAEILADVVGMITVAKAARYYGPYVLYVPQGYEMVLEADYRANDNRTVRQRLMALEGVSDIVVVDRLAAHTVLLIQMTSDVVDMAIAQGVSTVQWAVSGGLQQRYKVMSVMVPRVKSDYDSRSGIVKLAA